MFWLNKNKPQKITSNLQSERAIQFLKVIENLTTELNLEKILQSAADSAVKELGYNAAAVFLIDEEYNLRSLTVSSTKLVNTALKLIPESFNSLSVSLKEDKENLIVKSINENRIIIGNKEAEFIYPAVSKSIADKMQNLLNIKQMMAFPLKEKSKPIGAMFLSTTNEGELDRDLPIIESFSSTVAISITNASLFTETQKQLTIIEQKNENLQNLYNLTSRMSGTLDPEEVKSIAIDEISKFKDVDEIFIFKHDQELKKISIIDNDEEKSLEIPRSDRIEVQEFDDEENLLPQVVKRKKPVSTTKIKDNLSPFVGNSKAKDLEKNAVSVAFFPLFSGFEISGIVAFILNQNYANLDENQQQLLKTYSIQVSNALEKSRLYQLTEKNKNRLEKALKEVQELRRQEKDMIDVMGHELRTPITIVRNSLLVLESLQKNSDEIPQDKLKKYLDMAIESTRREITLIETLLSATKIDSNRLEFSKEKVDMLDVVNDSIEAQKFAAEEKDLDIKYEEPKDEIYAYADRTRTQEIMDNLLSNAVKYTQEGFVEIEVKQDKKFVYVSIIDSGIGIAQDDIEHLGKKFFRAKQYTNENKSDKEKVVRPGGTGLGLYVVFGSVRGMGGDIEVHSIVGKGTTFTFHLPKYTGQKETKTEDTKMKQKISVLNYDD